MIHKLKKTFLSKALVALACAIFLTVPGVSVAQAQDPPPPITEQSIADSVCQGVLGTQDSKINTNTTISDCQGGGNEAFTSVIRRIINIFSIVVGAVSVIMIIIGGFRYIISGGDSNGVSGAKNTILYAIVGLIIVIFAQVLVRFVVSSLTNAQNTTSTSQQQTVK